MATVDKQQAYMKKRRSAGLTYEQVGNEFGKSKSTAHRKARETKPKTKMNLRKGCIDMGSAK